MARVVWTGPAVRDVERERHYLAQISEHFASITVRRVRNSVRQLNQFPLVGRNVPEIPRTDYREIISRPYRIIYRYDEEQDIVYIAMVVHGQRQLPLELGGTP